MAAKISVCVPMYNESSIIEATAKTLHKYMTDTFEDFELIFIDDGSKDNSAGLVKDLRLANTEVLAYTPNRGKGCAVRTGMLETTGEIAMFIDADLAYGTDVIKQAYDALMAAPEKNVLVGSRTLHPEGYEGYTLIRKIASKTYIKVLSVYGGLTLSDSQCGCKAYKGSAVKEIFSRCKTDGFAFDFETILWAQKLGYGFVEMPVKIINHRESKVNVVSDTFKMLKELKVIKQRVKGEK